MKRAAKFEPRSYYRPFAFPWAFERYQQQNQIHWLPSEIPLGDDINDWKHRLNDKERHLLTQLFRFFTQADVDVSESYTFKYLNAFGHVPELRNMLLAFANMESIHQEAYALLLDTVGMPETEYKAFTKYEAMKNKHDFLANFNVDDPFETARSMAIISGGVEGVQLFSSFIILLNFPRFGRMKGMGQVVTWSVRDESLHVESLTELFREWVRAHREIWHDPLKKKIYSDMETIIDQEDLFIDLCFEMGGIDGLEPAEVKEYIRYIADRRLIGLGMKGIFKRKKNPIPWTDDMLNAMEHSNFFEARATEYSKGATKGTWDDVWKKWDSKIKTDIESPIVYAPHLPIEV